MFKEIIKRDGSVEPFYPSKVNKWSIWASEQLSGRVDWSAVVMETMRQFKDRIDSQELQKALIKTCISRKSWPYSLMAGRLYAAMFRKEVYNATVPPTIKEVHTRLQEVGLMSVLDYTDEEYTEIEEFIDHKRDYELAYSQVLQLRKKYALRNKVTGEEYETPQFVYMRMAMALSEKEPKDERLLHIVNYYNHLSFNRINAPTPNYVNLGTPSRGLISCCVYKANDTLPSLGAGDAIAYHMTGMSAGIGNMLSTRTLGDPVKGGAITHAGKLPYFRSLAYATMANKQNGRAGAAVSYYSAYDPENITMAMLQNPRTTEDKRIRQIHFGVMYNRWFSKKAALNEDIFTFTEYSAPDLWEAMFKGDQDEFEELYLKYESDPAFKKQYINARDFLILARTQAYECGTHYEFMTDEVNRHTPFLDPIYSSNLCAEIMLATKGYPDLSRLLQIDHHEGETAICAIAAIVKPNIHTDDVYESAVYYSLKMVDACLDISEFPFPHIGYTARARRSAGVGIIGLATEMARRGLKYDEQSGWDYCHELAEKHYYYLVKASLRLAKEKGNAPWINKTKWPQGWLPIDTYKKSLDQYVKPVYKYDWESLRQEIIAQGGIRHSVLCAHMPSESSSKSSGVPNSIYPIREIALKKSDNANLIDWVAMDSDLLKDKYQSAWEIDTKDMIVVYGIFQKFTDQAISADFWKDRSRDPAIYTDDMIEEHLLMRRVGMKSRYYQNSYTADKPLENNTLPTFTVESLQKLITTVNHNPLDKALSNEDVFEYQEDGGACAGGSCTI